MNMVSSKRAAMMEKKQEIMRQKSEAGSVATRFPEVASIIMSITRRGQDQYSGPFTSLLTVMHSF